MCTVRAVATVAFNPSYEQLILTQAAGYVSKWWAFKILKILQMPNRDAAPAKQHGLVRMRSVIRLGLRRSRFIQVVRFLCTVRAVGAHAL